MPGFEGCAYELLQFCTQLIDRRRLASANIIHAPIDNLITRRCFQIRLDNIGDKGKISALPPVPMYLRRFTLQQMMYENGYNRGVF